MRDVQDVAMLPSPPPQQQQQQQQHSDPDPFPPPEKLREIAAKQDERAREIKERRATELQQTLSPQCSTAEREDAAAHVIQRHYRGYRDRRALKGYRLDPSLRWVDAVKEARYRNATSPKPRSAEGRGGGTAGPRRNLAREKWRRAGAIARRAGSDDTSESEGGGTADDEAARRAWRRRDKQEREQYAKVMGLEYFLEMVDHKHRYGSNLRRYHREWRQSDSHENFFYWLDYGEGKALDLEDRPRKRLDTEQVRYLSREERKRYLVRIDAEGRFTWAKDGALITTSPAYRDSVEGIVPVDDKTPTWREVTAGAAPEREPDWSPSSSDVSSIGTRSDTEANAAYPNRELHDARGLAKLEHLNVDALMTRLLRKTTRKNTWIFVADTSFRLYIGIKQSGAFQHSSFLHGARVSAAGLIRIKRGRLRKLSPLSGHYAPPVRNFRGFVRNLRDAGADLSRCSLSRSYAVLLGLEGYLGAKKRVKLTQQALKDLLDPEEKRRRELAERDTSRSAQREREVLAQRKAAEEEEDERDRRRVSVRLKRLMGREEEGGAGDEDGAVGGGAEEERKGRGSAVRDFARRSLGLEASKELASKGVATEEHAGGGGGGDAADAAGRSAVGLDCDAGESERAS